MPVGPVGGIVTAFAPKCKPIEQGLVGDRTLSDRLKELAARLRIGKRARDRPVRRFSRTPGLA